MNKTSNRVGFIITAAVLLAGLSLIWSQTVSAAITLTPPPPENFYTAGVARIKIDLNTAGKTITFKASLTNSNLKKVKVLVTFGGHGQQITVTKTLKRFSISFPDAADGFFPIMLISTYRGHLETFLDDEVGGSLAIFNNPDDAHSIKINGLSVIDSERSGQCE